MPIVETSLNVRGWIKATRDEKENIEVILGELLDNSFETILLAKKKGTVELTVNISDSHEIQKITISDRCDSNTGIKDINQFFTLYKHTNRTDGLSKYGIGAKYALVQLANKYQIKTKTNKDCNFIQMDYENCEETFEYDNLEITDKYFEGKTGTDIIITDILPYYKSKIRNLIFDTEENSKGTLDYTESKRFTQKIMNLYPKIDALIDFNIYFKYPGKKRKEAIKENLPYLGKVEDTLRVKYIWLYRDPLTKEIYCYEDHGGILYDWSRSKTSTKDIFSNKRKEVIISKDYILLGKSKIIFSSLRQDELDRDETRYGNLCWGYSTIRTNKNTHRRTSSFLKLDWRGLQHQSRNKTFRCEIYYNSDLDGCFSSNSNKKISDDRMFPRSIRDTICSLTKKYQNEMKKLFGLYDTAKVTKTLYTNEEKKQKKIKDMEKPKNDILSPEKTTDIANKDIVNDTIKEPVKDTVNTKIENPDDTIRIEKKRQFSPKVKKSIIKKQKRKCANKPNSKLIKYETEEGIKDYDCPVWNSPKKGKLTKSFGSIIDGNFDHIIPYSKSGDSSESNCQLLCSNCHSVKTNFEK